MRFDIKGKKAIVTGGCMGMGKAIASAYVEEGVDVVILDISNTIDRVVTELNKKGPGKAFGLNVDLSDSNARKEVFREALKILGTIDILVNSAGIQHTCNSDKFPMDAWNKVLEVNLTAVFELSKLAGAEMLCQKSGCIINFASMISYIGGFRVPAYAASKGAVMQITKSFSNEWAGSGVRVNAIAPGYMDTPFNKGFMNNEKRRNFIMSRIPMQRWGTAEDITGLAIFLASDKASYISGATIPVDGGFIAN